MTGNMQMDSLVFGLISAASLPLGAAIAMFWTPKRKMAAAMMAFGGGALLAALTIDLVAESVTKGDFYYVAAGCIIGGILYEVLNSILNSKGGFLRKRSTTMTHMKKRKSKELRILFEKIGHVRFIRHIPKNELHKIVPFISLVEYEKGQNIFSVGEPGDEMFVVESGRVDIISPDNKTIKTLVKNSAYGELKALKSENHTDNAIAMEKTAIWILHKHDLENVAQHSPKIASTIEHYLNVHIDEPEHLDENEHQQDAWVEGALDQTHYHVDAKHEKKHGNAAMAIWLGILLDGIPESFVIGASFLVTQQHAGTEAAAGLSLSLLAGLFLSNFPEALSSSVGMRENKFSKFKIMFMWTSLMIITGLGALVGNIVLVGASAEVFPLIQGMAAGAMLTMISETMLPEAYEKGGSVVGLSTLAGFLIAIFFKEIG
jgi:zinc transporter ZupT